MDGYKLLRRDRQGRKGGSVALYIKECFDVEELGIGMIKLSVCYRLLNQDEETDEVFYEQLVETA